MITFRQNDRRFNFRVVGIAIHDGRVLLHRAEQTDFWALPGGRGELLEPAAETLRREMEEELNVAVAVERLVWIVENFFEYQGERFHELALYFQMHFPQDWPLLQHTDAFDGHENGIRLIFRWFPVDQLQGERVYPSFLRTGLATLPATTQHVVHTDL